MQNHFVKNGVYMALTLIFIQLVQYLVNPKLLFNPTLSLAIGILIPIFFMYLAAKSTKEENEGLLAYGEAVKATFLTYLIGSLMVIIFSFLLLNYIDPSLLDIQKEIAIETGEKMAGMFGADEAALEDIRERIEEEAGTYSIASALGGWLISLIFPGIIVALILSAFVKKNPSGI